MCKMSAHRLPTTASIITTILCSLIITASVLFFGIIFLAFPIAARNLLYPCLSEIDTSEEIEDTEETSELSPVVVLEGDAIRLAGACFIAIALSSVGLLVPLLPCCQYVKNNTTKEDTSSGVGNQNTQQQQLSNYFFLRTLLFMHGNVSLCLIAVGLVNLESSEDNNVYTDKLKCSSLKDNTILWMGVSMFALTSFGLMASFWPNTTTASSSREDKSSNTSQVVDEIANIRKWCRRRRKQTNHALLELENIEEPLLSTEEQQQESNIGEQHNDSETSRLRGTERLLKLAGGEAHYLWVGIAVLLFRLPFSLAIPHFVSTTIASLINEDFIGAKREVLLLFLIGSVDAVLDYWCIFLFGKAKENIVRSIRVDTFASILKQDFSFFDRTNTGDLISRLTSDCGEMAGDLTWFFRFSIEALVRITGISIYMIIRSPALGGCTLAIVPVVGIINKVYGDWLGKNAQKVQTALAKSTACAHESLSCIKTVITLGCEEHESKKYNTQIERLYDLSMKQLIVSGIYYMGVSTFLINTCVQAILLLIGAVFVQQGKLTPEILLAFMLYQGQLQEYTLNLFQSYSSLVKSSGAGDRVFFLLDRHPPPPGMGNFIVKNFHEEDTVENTSEDITFDNVSFSYPTRPDIKALNKLSFKVKSGNLVALVGHSGSGKSTVISLLERLYDPSEGVIKFGGTDLRSMNLTKHRGAIGLVTQEPVLFEGTIAENIGYGSSASIEEIMLVARIANAHDFIDKFPNKYNEQVGERGQNLSGGQRQRIVIARALVRKPALLLLDEATSALDSESEAAVQEALNELLSNRFGMTTIVVAHRLQTIRSADKIFVFKDGAVIQEGSHDELLQQAEGNNTYRRMIDRADSSGALPVKML